MEPWIEEARARTEPQYRELIGRKPVATDEDASLAFMRCGCGMLVITKPGLRDQDGICVACFEALRERRRREDDGRLVAQPRDRKSDRAAMLFLAVIIFFGVCHLAMNSRGAPDRDQVVLDHAPS